METLTLNNGLAMPMVGLGTWDLRGSECVKSVADALDMGYRMVDTAKMYGNEQEVGEGIRKSNVPREEIFVATKIDYGCHTYSGTKKSLDDSLQKMGLDYLDLIMLHRPDSNISSMYHALEEAYRAGKVKAIGISNCDARWYKKLMQDCSVVPMVNQVEVHLLFQKWELQKMLQEHDTAMEAWSPMGGPGCTKTVLGSDEVVEIAHSHQVTPAQVALRFLVQRGIAVIPKSRQEERRRQNLDLFSFSLTEAEMERLKTLDWNRTLHSWTDGL